MDPKEKPRSARQAEARRRALSALSRTRRQKLSLAEACRLEHIKPKTALRYVANAVRQDRPNGRYVATKGDKIRRDLRIPTALGPVAVPIYGSKAASEISKYANAVAIYLRTGKTSQLARFRGKTVGSRGRKIELLTDPATLSALADAGALQLDQLYATFAGAS